VSAAMPNITPQTTLGIAALTPTYAALLCGCGTTGSVIPIC